MSSGDYPTGLEHLTSLPGFARLAINRCNFPPVILGSLTFQQYPEQIQLEGVVPFHNQLFSALEQIADTEQRTENFSAYMRASFLLDRPDKAGFVIRKISDNQVNDILPVPTQKARIKRRKTREKADYLRILRGWMFDADGQEAAVLKSWVESRFGLLARNHKGPLRGFSSERYQIYLADRAQGLYNTNGLEAQLDLLYSYCQYELKRRYPGQTHFILYRGVNNLRQYEYLTEDKKQPVLLLNNLNSFSDSKEQAESFGDYILTVRVPLSKLLFFPDLLPKVLRGESEYLVLGGAYQVEVSYF